MLSRLAQGRSLLLTHVTRQMSVSSAAAKETAGPTVTLERRNDVAVCRINIPGASQNVLNERVTQDLLKVVDQVERDDSVKAVVLLSGKPTSFVAGADVNMLKKCKSPEEAATIAQEAQKHFERLEKFKKPVVAGIMGSCMGGGLELALACHYRIAVNDNKTKLALPEVMLGLLPGAGGTQRLPKLVSLQNALDMILTGKNIPAKKAKKMGLVDQVVEPLGAGLTSAQETTHKYLEDVAVDTARKLADGSLKANRDKSMMEKVTDTVMRNRLVLDNVVLKMAKDKVLKMTAGNYPAPLKILEVIRTGVISGSSDGYGAESKAFGELSQTKASKALIGLFEGSTDAKKNKYGKADPVKEVAVIGAGLMGAGIANVTVDKGIRCTLLDANDAGLERGRNQISTVLSNQEKRKRINKLEKETILSNLVTSLDYNAIKNADVVIEAVFEDLGLKHKVIKQIESVVSPKAVIATNTSALPIKDIAKASSRPENVIGMHYFSPVDKMQLLEIIVTDQTSKDTLAKAAALGLKQGKMVVVVKDCPGFFVVRCLHPMMSEIFRLFQEGMSPVDIDKITKNFGFPVGAATLADEVGLDVAEHVGVFLSGALGPRAGGVDGNLLTDLVKAGFKGRKTGRGIYDYGDGKKGSKKVNEDAVKLLTKYRKEPIASCASTEDRQMRLISRFINEAAICLEEGVISGPSDGDIASVFGIGFPPFWGGPFRFVDLYGADKLVDKMNRYADAYAYEQFAPCNILKDHAKSGKKFYPN